MSKWDKQLAKLRQNPKHVRFSDIENILLRLGFAKRQESTSHAVFTFGEHRITVPKPHGSPFVDEVYVKKFLLPLLEALDVIEEE
jgi:predicted RNA binding protein YcfA (HicA-like mRNA interferase family)